MTMVIPTLPSLPAGSVATATQMNQLSTACTFLLTKPIVRVHDAAGSLAITGSATAVPFNTSDFDTDGMWSSGSNTILTVQTPGWYKVAYGISFAGATNPVNTYIAGTTGPNNPGGSGNSIGHFWAGYSNGIVASPGGACGGSGVFPFYLYAGDKIQVNILSNTTGDTLSVSVSDSFFQAEYVSVG